jgi:hypothetical protein
MRRAGVAACAAVAALCGALAVAGCSTADGELEPTSGGQRPSGSPSSSRAPQAGDDCCAVRAPGPLHRSVLTADVLVTASRPLSAARRSRIGSVPGVVAGMPLSVAALSVDGRTLTVAGADPATFRRFTPVATAESVAVWRRVAGGEIAVDPSLPTKLADLRGYLRLGTVATAPAVHIGAYAPLVRHSQISVVVNARRARQLGMPQHNAMLLSTGVHDPAAVVRRLRSVVGAGATVTTLALQFDVPPVGTAVLSGGSVTRAVGTFTYTPHADGSVSPDPEWVRRYIRRETVPILGTVTCNKGMLPQLRAALDEVVAQGLSGSIHASEYGGCYVPRFIGHNPASGLSLHSWGIAVDLNVPGNLRGTAGQLDRRVVAIFERWGFAWGGRWRYTDPMHFEMNRVVRVP